MNKKDLKNGCVVEIRDGSKYIKIDNTLVCFEIVGDEIITYWLDLRLFKEDLTSVENKKIDIMKVHNDVMSDYGNCIKAINKTFNLDKPIWTWVRKEKPKSILTPKEKAYLKAVIEPVKDIVNFFQKVEHPSVQKQYIYIDLDGGCMNLYSFDSNTQFVNMDLQEEYTLEDLGLK